MKHTFLVEIGTEELPPRNLRKFAEVFANNIHCEFIKAGILHEEVNWFASPRRLAAQVIMLINLSVYKHLCNVGSGILQVFDSNGLSLSEVIEDWSSDYGIEIKYNNKHVSFFEGKWLIYREISEDINSVSDLLREIIYHALKKISATQMMRWGANDFRFIRPIHTLTVLLNDQVILGNIFGINFGRIIYGHRFMGKEKIFLGHANDYSQVLMEQGCVIVDYELRKQIIRTDIEKSAKKIGGFVVLHEQLLEEVTSLVEWPVVLTGSFDSVFLQLPAELLIHIMKCVYKFFPVNDLNEKLLPYFIFVVNIKSTDTRKIIFDNEQLIYSKLIDALYFFNNDCILRLEDYLPRLNNVLFHKKLGTLLDKTKRIEYLSSWLVTLIGGDVIEIVRAARLSKCDLLSDVVNGFPEVQGIIGMYYARRDGESELVALAQKEYYQPRFSTDNLPVLQTSCILAIVDRIDTISGIFVIQDYPKGNRDPFALRRAAIAVLRIIIERKMSVNLPLLIRESVSLYNAHVVIKDVVDKIIDFFIKRLLVFYKGQGFEIDIIKATLMYNLVNLSNFNERVRSVFDFSKTEESIVLKKVIKRISIILSKSNMVFHQEPQKSLLEKSDEIELFNQLLSFNVALDDMVREGRYLEVLYYLSKLSKFIDAFFDHVLVMVDNKEVCINRLSLLHKAYKLLTMVADLSLLE
ncbi:glycine--tRNA ligase subunit beta [Blochmannia endosymbiont of Colobopsis nipponica]|uniref:glycine--tRNA ligase subunit beta n=1 Tax=Blochmannia endosymbiont of Colobopsis nipponica TaxID=2681987 RepID=UPI00177EFCB9|nr:glycine--tRNA ligase subunit beta [Blochmannia endosymbiont of Colobopsis nipponica]QOI10825.1 glycine--tRNA ligase subunit beta [Blochmannia endosymbiont of Colobopsis nipponica]